MKGLSDEWTHCNEGPETWSAFDILGHLLHGEKTDWIARMDIILAEVGNKTFAPFDRFAQFTESKGKNLIQLLQEFTDARTKNIHYLRAKNITENDLSKTGMHPTFGEVTLKQLLAIDILKATMMQEIIYLMDP